MSLDLSQLTPTDLAALAQLIQAQGGLDALGRTPVNRPRQLHNLNLPPKANDARPTFFWSAESPRDGIDLTRTTLYPRLMWAKDGTEITVGGAKEEAEKRAEGYVVSPPANAEAPDPLDLLAAQWAALSPEDRDILIASQKKDKLASIQARLAVLSDEQLEALVGSVEKPRKRTA